VALSRFAVSNGMETQVRDAFLARPRLVDRVAGFVRMDVIQPRDDASEFWLITYWADEASYREWHRGHAYGASHAGIPRGLKLVKGRTEIICFDHVCS
jgi:heme-degrading monooxygenase HmoA